MNKRIIELWEAGKDKVRAKFQEAMPDSYDDIVHAVVEIMGSGDPYSDEVCMDPKRITCIDEGDYQGTRIYVVGSKGYQPRTYYAVSVDYGSCSGCDSLEAIKDGGDRYSDNAKPNEQQVSDLMTLALHIAQGFKRIFGPDTDKEQDR